MVAALYHAGSTRSGDGPDTPARPCVLCRTGARVGTSEPPLTPAPGRPRAHRHSGCHVLCACCTRIPRRWQPFCALTVLSLCAFLWLQRLSSGRDAVWRDDSLTRTECQQVLISHCSVSRSFVHPWTIKFGGGMERGS